MRFPLYPPTGQTVRSRCVLAGGVFLTSISTVAIVILATVEALTAQRCPHDTSSSVGRQSCLLAGLVSGAGDCRKKPIQRTARGFQMPVPAPSLTSPVCPVAPWKSRAECCISTEPPSTLWSFSAFALCPCDSPRISAKLHGAPSPDASTPAVPGPLRPSAVRHVERPPSCWRAFRVLMAKPGGRPSDLPRRIPPSHWHGLFLPPVQQLCHG